MDISGIYEYMWHGDGGADFIRKKCTSIIKQLYLCKQQKFISLDFNLASILAVYLYYWFILPTCKFCNIETFSHFWIYFDRLEGQAIYWIYIKKVTVWRLWTILNNLDRVYTLLWTCDIGNSDEKKYDQWQSNEILSFSFLAKCWHKYS